MNYKELFSTLESVANEKGLSDALVYQATQKALASVFRKSLGEDAAIDVVFHKEGIEGFRLWTVVADDSRLDNPAREMRLMDAQEIWPDSQIGDLHKERLADPSWTRVAAQAFRQILIQSIREAERERTRSEWQHRLNSMVSATVKRWEKGRLHVDVEGHEAMIERAHLMVGEHPRVGHRLMVWISGLNPTARGPVLQASRTDPGLLIALLEREVPEIYAGTVRVRACVRQRGARSKVAVESLTSAVDPIASCVGMRGVRIQAVVNELNGERLDLLKWSEEPAELAVRALAPARVERVIKDEGQRKLFLAVHDDDLAMAVGRQGQQAQQISQLLDWDVEITTVLGLEQLLAEEQQSQSLTLQASLNIDEGLADLLVSEGFVDVEVIAYCDRLELLQLEGLDEEMVDELKDRSALALESSFVQPECWEDVPAATQAALVARGIESWEDLAECSVDELEGVQGLSAEQAAAWIMKARQPWFEAAQD